MYKTISFTIVGVAPLLMHNGQMADPMNKFSRAMKAVTSKKKKTEEDYLEMARIEFNGGLYIGDKGQPVLPGELIEACLINGAKATKQGKVAKSALIVDGNFPLDFAGPKTAPELFEDDNHRHTVGVKVGQARVMRTRPKFNDWKLNFDVHYLPESLNPAEVVEFVETAGRVAGLGDGRPRFGRYNVESHTANLPVKAVA